jgi:hypothetical protein
MQLHSARTFPPSPSPKEAIPYTSEALRQDLQRVRDAWADCQASRDRNAIYGYLSAVYGLVAWWTAEGQDRAVGVTSRIVFSWLHSLDMGPPSIRGTQRC